MEKREIAKDGLGRAGRERRSERGGWLRRTAGAACPGLVPFCLSSRARLDLGEADEAAVGGEEGVPVSDGKEESRTSTTLMQQKKK